MNTEIKNIINLPTTSEGGLKEKLALTKMAQDASLNIEIEGNSIITVNGVTVVSEALIASALMVGYDDKSSLDINGLAKLWSEGYVIPTQRNIAQRGTAAKPILIPSKQVLTAREYKEGNIRIADIDNLQLFDEVAVLLSRSNTTKQELLDFCFNLRDKLFSADKIEVYEIKIAQELELAKKYEGLTLVGFTDIKQLSDNLISGIVPASQAGTAIPELANLGYTLKSSNFNASDFTITVTFSDVPDNKII